MFNRVFITFIFSSLLLGCGQPKFSLVKPPETDADNRSLVTVYRDGKRPGTVHWIGLNGNLMVELNEKEYTEFFVNAGANEIFTMCTLPTLGFENFMTAISAPDNNKDRIYKVDPFVTKDIDTCYISSEYESAFGDNCAQIKLTRQDNKVCSEKRKQLSFVEPGTNEKNPK